MGKKSKCTLQEVMLGTGVMSRILNAQRNIVVYEDFIGIHLK